MNETTRQNQIKNRFINILERVQETCVRHDRDPQSVKLIVVTKGHSTEEIQQVITAGATYLGENYAEETMQKKTELGDLVHQAEWHMIGHIQSRKTKLVSSLYDCIHSIDRLKIAEKLNNQLLQEGRQIPIPVMLQYNVGGEDQKHGWQAEDEKNWKTLVPEFEKILQLKQLNVVGLMTMPPLTNNKNEALLNFQKMIRLKDFLQRELNYLGLEEMSMGTSHDYEAAIQAGATYIRIGTAIMGERIYKV